MVSGSLTGSLGTDRERVAAAMNSTENTKAPTQSTAGSVGHTVQKSHLESGYRLTGREDYGKTAQREWHTLVWTKIAHAISKHLQLTCLFKRFQLMQSCLVLPRLPVPWRQSIHSERLIFNIYKEPNSKKTDHPINNR